MRPGSLLKHHLYPRRPTSAQARRGIALYSAVMANALLVGLLGLAALQIVQIERRRNQGSSDASTAELYAHTAAELGIRDLNASAWRTRYTSGQATTPLNFGNGTVSWSLSDSDGSFSNADVALKLRAIGRVGDATQVTGVDLTHGSTIIGPTILRSMTSSSSASQDELKHDKLWGQYLKVTLPPEATGWWVTSVELYCQHKNGNGTVNVRIYEPGSNNRPSSTVIDSMSLSTNSISILWHWQVFNLSGDYLLDPTEGICVTIETTDTNKTPIEIEYRGGGMSEANSALLRGNPAWNSTETDKALRYRINGKYRTGLQPVAGTWRRMSAP